MINKEYTQILVDGKVHNIIRGDENQRCKAVTLFIDEEENRGVACKCLRSIPSKTEAAGRTFKTLGSIIKYL